MTSVPILFNCLRRERDVYVRVGDDLVELPRGPQPTLLDDSDDEQFLDVVLGVGDDAPVVTLRSGHARCTTTLSMPEPLPGALYLVDAAILLRHPHRDDLVAPASYGVEFVDGADGKRAMLSYLVAVHRRIDVVGPEGVTNVDLDADDDPGGPAEA